MYCGCFQLPAVGFYEICLRNQLSYQQTVTLNFHVAPQAAASPGVKGGASPVFPDVNQLVMSSHTEELKNLSDKVLEMVGCNVGWCLRAPVGCSEFSSL